MTVSPALSAFFEAAVMVQNGTAALPGPVSLQLGELPSTNQAVAALAGAPCRTTMPMASVIVMMQARAVIRLERGLAAICQSPREVE